MGPVPERCDDLLHAPFVSTRQVQVGLGWAGLGWLALWRRGGRLKSERERGAPGRTEKENNKVKSTTTRKESEAQVGRIRQAVQGKEMKCARSSKYEKLQWNWESLEDLGRVSSGQGRMILYVVCTEYLQY